MTNDQVVEALVRAAGIDPYLAKQRVQRGAPQVTAMIDAETAPEVVAVLKKLGISAFAPTTEELAATPEPVRAKRLIRADGAPMFMVEPWKGTPCGLRCDEVFLIVRGRVDTSVTKTIVGSSGGDDFGWQAGMAFGYGAEVGIAASMTGGMGEPAAPVRTTSHSVRFMIDLYTGSGLRVRCNSEKFNFDVLGKLAMTDLENSERLALLLAEECQSALIDTNFKAFRCPGDVITTSRRHLGSTTVDRRDDVPVFEFYSAWTYAHTKHLLRS